VDAFDVAADGTEGGEGLDAAFEEADEGSLLGVGAEVSLEVDVLAEVAVASRKGTFVGPEGGMDQLVGFKVPHGREGLSAFAHKGTLACVAPDVGFEVGGRGEGLGAAFKGARMVFSHFDGAGGTKLERWEGRASQDISKK